MPAILPFLRVGEKELVARFNEFLCHILEIFQFYSALKLEVVVGKKVDSGNQRAVFPAPGKILCDFIHGVCLGFCLLFLQMLKGLASYLFCHMQCVQSSHNSHSSVSTLTIPHMFHRELLQFFSHLLFLQANFNWLAWSGIWLHLPLGQLMGQKLCGSCAIYLWGQLGFESNPAGRHNPQISCNMCFSSPCGWMC